MKIRQFIGIILIFVALFSLYKSYTFTKEIREGYEFARSEVILNSNQIELNEINTLTTDYRFAHGIIVSNSREAGNEVSPDLIVVLPDGNTVNLVFAEGNEFRIYKGPITVSKVTQFEGQISFLNSVCGCENMGPFIVLIASVCACLIFIPLGLYLTLKKSSNKSS